VDVGTNAEIVLGDRQQVLVASSPTGPAFEGAQITHGQRAAPGAIERVRIDRQTLEPRIRVIGHDEVDRSGDWGGTPSPGQSYRHLRQRHHRGRGRAVPVRCAQLTWIIQKVAAEQTPRVRYNGRTAEYVLVDADQSATGAPIIITQNDVRQIQLAKAALYAGSKLLMNQRGIQKVDRIVLAGAFGNFINPFHAMVLGLVPNCDLEKVEAVGNAAGDGARFALLNRGLRQKAAELARWAVHIATPLEASFQDEFVAALDLPHARDAFSSLEGRLPEQKKGESRRGRRNRIREKYAGRDAGDLTEQ
jgi:uncharacterized 2Fe-2S/4Fe-4S cluster protein (DUF4445 family)